MRRLGLALMVATTTTAALHGCGLDLVGIDNTPLPDSSVVLDGSSFGDGGPTDGSVRDGQGPTSDAAPRDAAADADADAPPPCTCPLEAPPGWARVGYADNRSAECGGDLKKEERVANPVPGAGACTCNCQVTTQPDCNKGNFGSLTDNSAQPNCGTAGVTRPANDGNCTKASNNLGSHRRAVPPDPVGGACSGTTTTQAGSVTSSSVRVCAEAAGGKTCACQAPGFTTCIRGDGDKTCPSGFAKRTLIGEKAAVTCPGTCGCSLTNVTCSGKIAYFNDDACHSLIEEIDDKSCQQEKGSNFDSYRWTGTPNVTCTAGPAPGGVAALDGVETVCCP